jgi:membrane protease YdiL (CAAX protease family)
VVIPAVSPAAAVAGGPGIKLLFLGRMVLLLAVATVLLRLSGRRWAELGLRKVKPLRFFLGVVVGFAAATLLVMAANVALAQAGLKAQSDYSMFEPLRGNLALYLFFLIPVTWGSAAFGEELLFRGFLMDRLLRLFGSDGRVATFLAILAQAALFGLGHLYQGPAGVAATAAVGLGFALAWWVSGRNLWPCIMLHGFFDTASMTSMYLGAFHPR